MEKAIDRIRNISEDSLGFRMYSNILYSILRHSTWMDREGFKEFLKVYRAQSDTRFWDLWDWWHEPAQELNRALQDVNNAFIENIQGSVVMLSGANGRAWVRHKNEEWLVKKEPLHREEPFSRAQRAVGEAVGHIFDGHTPGATPPQEEIEVFEKVIRKITSGLIMQKSGFNILLGCASTHSTVSYTDGEWRVQCREETEMLDDPENAIRKAINCLLEVE